MHAPEHPISPNGWSQLNVSLRATTGSLRDAAWPLFDALGHALEASESAQWWFVRKQPGLRLRLRGEERRVQELLRAASCVERWGWATYEPELPRLGGPVALELVHTLLAQHCALWIEWEREVQSGQTRLGPGFLALLHYQELVTQSLRAPEEVWDVWFTLSRSYDPRAGAPELHEPNVSILTNLPRLASEAERELLARGRAVALEFADGLREAHDRCTLWGGRRALLATLASFLFNLWGLSPDAITTLCRLAVRELDPRPRMPARPASSSEALR